MNSLGKKKIITSAVVALALSAGVATTTKAEVTRLDGIDRYSTSDAIVKAGWPTGSATAILASGLDDNTVDALTVAPLAKDKNAPVVLVNPKDSVPNIVAKFKALNTSTVYIANGTGVISTQVEAGLKTAGITNIIRLGGANRYDTALNIAKTLGTSSNIVIANGEDAHLVDSLSIAPISAIKKMPIFLTGSTLDAATTDYIKGLGAKTTYVLGGTNLVSEKVTNTLPGVIRLAGSGRYETNAKVVEAFKADTVLNSNNIFIASGEDENLVDALAGAPLAASKVAPIVFVHDAINPAVSTLLESIVNGTTKITELGGIGAVTKAADAEIKEIQATATNSVVTSVSLNKTIGTIVVGETDNLTATVNPTTATNKSVTWTSSNSAVATVDSTGKVTAVSAGTATITVTTAEGKFTATCNITVNNKDTSNAEYHSSLQKNLFDYLMDENNRQAVMKRAIELHGGDPSNTCVYFASEALRRAGLTTLPESVCNTLGFTSALDKMQWTTSKDLSQLRPGDVCFTKSYGPAGPTHSYIFMKWSVPGKYDYGYICDNQGNEYGDNIYHIRNINIATDTKEPIDYFMYKH